MARRINGILFDLGETLLDYGPVNVDALFRAGGRLAYDYLRSLGEPVPSFTRYHLQQFLAVRWNYVKSHIVDREFKALDVIRRMSRRMGQRLTDEQALELARLWYRPLGEKATVEPDARATLETFRRDGLTLGLVSNTFVPPPILDEHLRQEGLLDLLPVRVYSCEVGFRKPRREIFSTVLKRTGLTAGETLFVGDSIRADIRGSNQAGMISVLKDPMNRHARSRTKPQHRIRNLSELVPIVAGYNDSPAGVSS